MVEPMLPIVSERFCHDYRRIWLVGASTGIGAALLQQLDAPGVRIIASARTESSLNRACASTVGGVEPLTIDVCEPKDIQAAVDYIGDALKGLDLLVVNAGTCEYIDTDEMDLEAVERVMQTNFYGAVRVIKAALPLLRAARGGKVRPKLLVVSSSVTFQALPRAHAYGASKAALRYFVECLHIDLQKEGIEVQIVSPGFVRTPLTEQNDFPMPFLISAEEAAQIICKHLHSNVFDIVFPKPFIYMLKTFAGLPQRLKFRLLKNLSRHEPPALPKPGNSDM
jgi:short-subunit dehydrogenase